MLNGDFRAQRPAEVSREFFNTISPRTPVVTRGKSIEKLSNDDSAGRSRDQALAARVLDRSDVARPKLLSIS